MGCGTPDPNTQDQKPCLRGLIKKPSKNSLCKQGFQIFSLWLADANSWTLYLPLLVWVKGIFYQPLSHQTPGVHPWTMNILTWRTHILSWLPWSISARLSTVCRTRWLWRTCIPCTSPPGSSSSCALTLQRGQWLCLTKKHLTHPDLYLEVLPSGRFYFLSSQVTLKIINNNKNMYVVAP